MERESERAREGGRFGDRGKRARAQDWKWVRSCCLYTPSCTVSLAMLELSALQTEPLFMPYRFIPQTCVCVMHEWCVKPQCTPHNAIVCQNFAWSVRVDTHISPAAYVCMCVKRSCSAPGPSTLQSSSFSALIASVCGQTHPLPFLAGV